ncbi:MAG TPA: hypothetical protein VML55_12560 [Planctomycetaceae bacterium]|nr:hypothetical protein [Planctomycetaceae bacterium]
MELRPTEPFAPRGLDIRGLTIVAALVSAGFIGGAARADEIRLRNGILLEGKPVPVQGLNRQTIEQNQSGPVPSYPILLVHTGMTRYFVPARQVEQIDRDAIRSYEEFKLPPHLKQSRRLMFQTLGGLLEITDFDEHGRRRVTANVGGTPTHIVQGITTINPKYVTVEALNFNWEHGISTTAIPVEQLDAMLRRNTAQNDPHVRLAIAVFYMQAGLYVESAAELDRIRVEFPELKDTVDEVTLRLRELQGRKLLADLRERRAAGQFELAYEAARQFPTERMSAAVLSEARRQIDEHRTMQEQRDRALMRLGELQAELTDPRQAAEAEAARAALRQELDLASLGRLDAFLKFAGDEALPADQRLAFAYSGWVLGSANAAGDLDLALRLWTARFLVREYLREPDSTRRTELLAKLTALEGLSIERVSQLIPQLPPAIDTPDAEPGRPIPISVADADPETPVSYSVLLPLEYSPNHVYPAIVALHPAGRPPEDELVWWGGTAEKPGQAQRHGCIVIAPAYCDPKQGEYDHAATAHYIVLKSLRDARQRFSIDSDRVFLSGHGMGGDAAFDIGMSHPDVFAGVMPITGLCGGYGKWYWDNAKYVPWYVVTGELARGSLSDADHARSLNRMMVRGNEYDVIYAEYVGRGYEHYYEEIHRLFEWMGRHRRQRLPKEFSVSVLRPTDDRFFWGRFAGLPRSVLQSSPLGGTARSVRPMTFGLRVADASSDRTVVYLDSGAERHTIYLSPELVDFDKRLLVRWQGRQKFNDFLHPEIETLLEDFRVRGDRQMLFWSKIEVE